MKHFFALIAFFSAITFSVETFTQQSARFLSVMSEMPLMPGLFEVPDTITIFDGPSGRIVEVVAIGDVSVDAIRTFYAAALPQLGWVLSGNGDYRQDAEVLRVDFIRKPFGSSKGGVRFVVHPLRAK